MSIENVTVKEMIDWIESERDRVRNVAINLAVPTRLTAYASYMDDLNGTSGILNRFAHLRSESESASFDQVSVGEILSDLYLLQEDLPINSTEPAFQYYRSSLVQLEMDIHNIAKTIAQSKLGENHDH